MRLRFFVIIVKYPFFVFMYRPLDRFPISRQNKRLKNFCNHELSFFEETPRALNKETFFKLINQVKNYYNFYNGYDPQFTWWVPKTYTGLDSLLNLYASSLKKKGKINTSQKDDGSGIIGNPIGSDELIRTLKLEFIPYTAEELVDIANKEFAWCDAELLKASREMGFGDDWKAAQEKVKNMYVLGTHQVNRGSYPL